MNRVETGPLIRRHLIVAVKQSTRDVGNQGRYVVQWN